MSNTSDHPGLLVEKASADPALFSDLSDQLVPVMMHLSLEEVRQYKALLEPLLSTLPRGSEPYTYLIIVYGFLSYRDAEFIEVTELLNAYEAEFESTFSNAMRVGINGLIGASFRSLGQTEFALEFFQRNIPFNHVERQDHSYFYSLTLYHIAELYGELGEYQDMLEKHMLSLDFYEITRNKDFYFRSLNGVGRAYQGLKDYDAALRYFLSVEDESKQKANIPLRARNLHDLGAMYAEIEVFEKSIEYYEYALEIRKKHSLTNASITTMMEMGRIFIRDEKLEKAIILLEEALQEAVRIDVKKKQYKVCKLLSEAYEKANRVDRALEYHKKFHSIKEEVDNVQYTQAENQRVREINTQLEEQRKLIEVQSIKIEESHKSIQALNENLESLVSERTHQLMERTEQLKHYAFMNAHEVRGPLSTILGLLQIATEFRTAEEKAELIQMIEESALKLDAIVRNMHRDLVQFKEVP